MPRHRLLFFIPPLAGALLATTGSAAPVAIERDAALAALIGEREVIFLARELEGDRSYTLSPGRIDERHPPFSTFKIPNLLIALETGVIDDPEARRERDPEKRPAEEYWPAVWKQPHSLVSAFRRSAVWFFRDVAVEVGSPSYREWLADFGYGNEVAADGNDGFWLDGTLRISPREQVAFLGRLLAGEFEVAEEHMAVLREASLLTTRGSCRLHGKTGAGSAGEDFDGPFEGWLVGWTQCGDEAPTVFALWTRAESYRAIRNFRQDAATALLTRIGAYPTFEE